MAGENKADACVELVLQESNSKTKLEVSNVFRILSTKDNGEGSRRRQKKVQTTRLRSPVREGNIKRLSEKDRCPTGSCSSNSALKGSCDGEKRPGPEGHGHCKKAEGDPKGAAAGGSQLTTPEAGCLLKEGVHGTSPWCHSKLLHRRVST